MNINGQASLRPIYKTYFFYFTHLNVLFVCVSIYHLNPWGQGGQKRASAPLGLEVKMFVGHHMYSRIKSWSCMWTNSALNQQAISLAFGDLTSTVCEYEMPPEVTYITGKWWCYSIFQPSLLIVSTVASHILQLSFICCLSGIHPNRCKIPFHCWFIVYIINDWYQPNLVVVVWREGPCCV